MRANLADLEAVGGSVSAYYGLATQGYENLSNNMLYYRTQDLVVPVIGGQPHIVRLPNGKEMVGSEILETQHEEDGNYKAIRSVNF